MQDEMCQQCQIPNPDPPRRSSDVHSLHFDGSFENLKVCNESPTIVGPSVKLSSENFQNSVAKDATSYKESLLHRATYSDSFLLSPRSSAKKPEQQRKKPAEPKNYLILNKKQRRGKTYVERFRERAGEQPPAEVDGAEGASVAAERGDSAEGSVGDDADVSEDGGPFDTECYNDLFYEQLLVTERKLGAQDLAQHEELKMDLVVSGSGDDSCTRRSAGGRRSRAGGRGASAGDAGHAAPPSHPAPPPPPCPHGGLGPDMQTLRPQLDRARSIKRYSERVRIENQHRIKCYVSSKTVIAQPIAPPARKYFELDRHMAIGKAHAGEPVGPFRAGRKDFRKGGNNERKTMTTLENGGSTPQKPNSKWRADGSIARQLFSKPRQSTNKQDKSQLGILNSKFQSQNQKTRANHLNREETSSKRMEPNAEFASWRRYRDASVAVPTSLEALEERHRMYRAAVSGACAAVSTVHLRRATRRLSQ